MKAKWVPNFKEHELPEGYGGSIGIEYSIVRNNNTHGKASYGWADENKIIVANSGEIPRDEIVLNRLKEICITMANALNERGL